MVVDMKVDALWSVDSRYAIIGLVYLDKYMWLNKTVKRMST